MEFLVLKGFGCLQVSFDRGQSINVFINDISYELGEKSYGCCFMWKMETLVPT